LNHIDRSIPGWFLLFSVVAFAPAWGATFPYGVSSGVIAHDRAVVWTQTGDAATLTAQVSADATFDEIVLETSVGTTPGRDYTAKLIVTGLSASTDYHYRFTDVVDGSISPTGRFRTPPAPHESEPLRFVFSGDSNYRRAPFHVLDFAVDEEAGFFLWFGDTIYGDAPAGELGVARTLDDYRAKYRQIRVDSALRRMLASTGAVVGWDDHEVANDYDGGDPDGAISRERIDAAYRAFFEHMPIAEEGIADDPYRTYRRIRWGRTAEFFVLDGRQYRDRDAEDLCGGNVDPFGVVFGFFADPACIEALREPRTMLGPEQLAWLKTGLAASDAAVKFIVSDLPFTFFGPVPYDRWDGYDAERREILEFIDAQRIEDVWILTTDLHVNVYNPDVNSVLRRHRPEIDLDNGIEVPEVIAGPIATSTFAQAAIREAGAMLGIEASLGTSPLLEGLFNDVVLWIERMNELAFIETNRYGYAVVEVSADGKVGLAFRGIDPQASDVVTIATLFDTRAIDERVPGLCGAVGLLPLIFTALMLGAWSECRRRR
jgi:alkaline phosphatase D